MTDVENMQDDKVKVSTRVTKREYRLIKAVAEGYGYGGVSELLRELLFSTVREAASALGGSHHSGDGSEDIAGEIDAMFKRMGESDGEWNDDIRKRRG